jgi:hypothetical protein
MRIWMPESGFAPAGATFRDALSSAMLTSRAEGDLAQAILQGQDGSWLLAPLARQDAKDPSGYSGVVLDGVSLPNGVANVQVKPVDAAIKAIVGHGTVFNFTGQATPTVELTGPDAWKNELIASVRSKQESPLKGLEFKLVGRDDAAHVGSVLDDALRQATLAARDGVNGIQAVVKDTAGSYFITRVDGLANGNDLIPSLRLRDIDQANPSSGSLQALVGTKGMVRFNDALQRMEQSATTPAAPAAKEVTAR